MAMLGVKPIVKMHFDPVTLPGRFLGHTEHHLIAAYTDHNRLFGKLRWCAIQMVHQTRVELLLRGHLDKRPTPLKKPMVCVPNSSYQRPS